MHLQQSSYTTYCGDCERVVFGVFFFFFLFLAAGHTATCKIHDDAQVRLLGTHAQYRDDIRMLKRTADDCCD